jgi:hypothetical protein
MSREAGQGNCEREFFLEILEILEILTFLSSRNHGAREGLLFSCIIPSWALIKSSLFYNKMFI